MLRVFLLLFIVVSIESSLFAENLPRVKIADGTLVAADGRMLRGTTFFVDMYGIADMRENESRYHEYFLSIFQQHDLNCVRIGPWLGDWKYDIAKNEMHRSEYLYAIDTVVNWCAENGVYAIINLHTQYNTPVELDKAQAFWSVIAPCYKDRTHVIYELSNEPEPTSSLTNMSEIYEFVAVLAPDTHQILFSHVAATQLELDQLAAATQGVDFSNTSIGFHCYDNVLLNTTQWDHAQKIRAAGYPVICTEYLSLTNNNDMPIRFEALMHCMMRAEERKISWISWGPFAQLRNPNKPGWTNDALRYTPEFEAAKRRYCIDFATGTQWPSDGMYRLKSLAGTGFLTRTKGDWSEVTLEENFDKISSVWVLKRFDGNMYRLQSSEDVNLCLHDRFDDDQTWIPAVTAEYHDDWNSQKFQLLRTGKNVYQIRCRWGDLFLTAGANDSKVRTAPLTHELSQHWALEKVAQP